MQQYTIGRSNTCRIRIPGSKDRISREHATLKVMDNGKISIMDSSANGTYVNGVKIAPHVEYPVKRGDNISFAKEYELDWEAVAKPKKKRLVYWVAVIGLAAAGAGVAFFLLLQEPEPAVHPGRVETTVPEGDGEPAGIPRQEEPDTAGAKKPPRAAGKETPVPAAPEKEGQQAPAHAADTSQVIIF